MYKMLAVLLLSVSLSATSSENSNESNVSDESNLIESLFNIRSWRCETFPECKGDSEEQKMMEEEEMERAGYYENDEDKTNSSN